MLKYATPLWLSAGTTGKGEELDEARAYGAGSPLALPRQTHSDHVKYVCSACRPEDTDAVFTDVPLRMGENTIAAKTTNAEDSITLNGVEEHNGAYDLPDVIDALNAGNWFLENDDEQPEEENCYNIEILSGQLVANDTCHRIIKGWIMAHEQTPLETRLGIVSRIPSCEAIWGKCKIYELPPIKKIMTQDDLNKLDKMLRRIKRT